MPRQILYKLPIRTLPLFYIIRRPRRKHIQRRMEHQTPHTFLVIREGANGFSRRQIPQANCCVMGTGDHLGLGGLGDHTGHGVCVAGECVHVGLCAHVPYTGCWVAASGQEDVDCGVEGEGVDGGQVAMIMSDDLRKKVEKNFCLKTNLTEN